jgi:carbon storage regulator
VGSGREPVDTNIVQLGGSVKVSLCLAQNGTEAARDTKAQKLIGGDGNASFKWSNINWEKTMLVLSRKLGEKIVIGDNIVVTVVKIDRNQIRIGIEAPSDVPVYREEIAPQRITKVTRTSPLALSR